ncbi:MAG: hypothetical protein A2908_02075 [Candidatus Staskawiczbacteria bacterium RIFCSPLOWO2_01_FULL_38_12b]|uniref:Response regulatory domain-containing protein n=1 Tax=Candidatus Staskawiczbacteria bacterium RIFCSPLOWO2_01_FULL_38_12b TaxID=1802214 RepID=A0A1G2IH88_9BACT|nr:MAG: hypothetical protein A2908_02075 [Candidatus Staskawiczbacteria bacterium RIFCSPLOWO2_01_FULL_38_12b]
MVNESGGPKKILVIEEVEDDDSLRDVLGEKFINEGFNVIKARNGEEGLKIALREQPDLILLDLLMPVMDGLTMMDKIRNDDGAYGKNVPIVILTNMQPDDDKIMSAVTKNQPAYYLVKSAWTMDQLVEKVKERLGRKT